MGGEVKISSCRCKDVKIELHLSLVHDPLEPFLAILWEPKSQSVHFEFIQLELLKKSTSTYCNPSSILEKYRSVYFGL